MFCQLFLHRVSPITSSSCFSFFVLSSSPFHQLPLVYPPSPPLELPVSSFHLLSPSLIMYSSSAHLSRHVLYLLRSLSAWASMTSLHLPPPSTADPHYSSVPLTYNMSQQWWLLLCLSLVGALMPCELTWHLSPSSIVNETTLEVVDSREINISVADTTQWQLQGLNEGSLYRFHLSACTRAGCGPPLAQESSTIAQARE